MALANFKAEHWTLVGGFLVGVAGVIAGLPDWHSALTPLTISAFLVQLGIVFKSITSDKPTKEWFS